MAEVKPRTVVQQYKALPQVSGPVDLYFKGKYKGSSSKKEFDSASEAKDWTTKEGI